MTVRGRHLNQSDINGLTTTAQQFGNFRKEDGHIIRLAGIYQFPGTVADEITAIAQMPFELRLADRFRMFQVKLKQCDVIQTQNMHSQRFQEPVGCCRHGVTPDPVAGFYRCQCLFNCFANNGHCYNSSKVYC